MVAGATSSEIANTLASYIARFRGSSCNDWDFYYSIKSFELIVFQIINLTFFPNKGVVKKTQLKEILKLFGVGVLKNVCVFW